MQSDADYFKSFVSRLISLGILSQEAVDYFLLALGGVDEVIEDELYISACEELGRGISRNHDFRFVVKLFKENTALLIEKPEWLYYFVEAIIGVKSTIKDNDIKKLIELSPERYKPFLLKCFHE